MDLSEETYERAVRLGRLVPKVVEIKRFVDVTTAPTNVIVAPIPVSRPDMVFHEYPPAQDILDSVCEFYGVSAIDIKSSRRPDRIVRPRHVCMYLMRDLTLMSLPAIGRFLGGKDHTGPLYAAEKITVEIKDNPRLVDEIDLLKIKIAERLSVRNAG